MNRHLPLVVVAIVAIAACSKSSGLSSIEEAEAYAKARGVMLSERSENTEQAVAPRAYDYKANGTVKLGITQFASPEAAAAWKKMSDEMPFGGETIIQKGPVCFSVWGATDAERQNVITALQ